jgi:hypothetical protein
VRAIRARNAPRLIQTQFGGTVKLGNHVFLKYESVSGKSGHRFCVRTRDKSETWSWMTILRKVIMISDVTPCRPFPSCVYFKSPLMMGMMRRRDPTK